MNLLADEGVDRPIVERLRQAGHVVMYVAEMEPSIDDDIVLDRANQHRAVLVTKKCGWKLRGFTHARVPASRGKPPSRV